VRIRRNPTRAPPRVSLDGLELSAFFILGSTHFLLFL
jgi:hypothetical protein